MWPFPVKYDPNELIPMNEIDDWEPSRFQKMWWPICRYFEDIYRQIRWFPANILRLISYLPIIWQDRDWDYAYVLYILQHKLRRMHKRWDSSPRYVGGHKDKLNMRQCLIILNRIIKDDYISRECDIAYIPDVELNKVWDKKWGKKFHSAADRAREKEKADWDSLWIILSKELGKWWD